MASRSLSAGDKDTDTHILALSRLRTEMVLSAAVPIPLVHANHGCNKLSETQKWKLPICPTGGAGPPVVVTLASHRLLLSGLRNAPNRAYNTHS